MTEKLPIYKSVLVINDHKMVANGVKLLIGNLFEDFYMAHDGASAMSLALRHNPELAILDYLLPDTSGDYLARELKYKIPSIKLLAYSNSYSAETISKMLRAGVDGYQIEKKGDDDFINAIHGLMDGRDAFCKEARAHIVNRFSDDVSDLTPKYSIGSTKLSGKEIELIKLLCKQMTTKEISKKLKLTERTIEQYRSKLLHKIEAKNVAGILKFALLYGIISVDEL